jgi:hypothetical protein
MGTLGDEETVTLLARRRIEAAMLAEVFAVLAQRLGEEQALSCIEDTVGRAAFAAGQAFAATAPDGPNLAHFGAVVELWRRGDALTIANVRSETDRLSFDVTRCRYAESYREMGLPEVLATRVSCLRDRAFAAGYSPKLRFERPCTIASGASCCPFTFTWDADR